MSANEAPAAPRAVPRTRHVPQLPVSRPLPPSPNCHTMTPAPSSEGPPTLSPLPLPRPSPSPRSSLLPRPCLSPVLSPLAPPDPPTICCRPLASPSRCSARTAPATAARPMIQPARVCVRGAGAQGPGRLLTQAIARIRVSRGAARPAGEALALHIRGGAGEPTTRLSLLQ